MALKLRKNNLYANAKQFIFDSGEKLLLRDKFSADMFTSFDYHLVKQDENLSDIAYKYFVYKVEDPSKFWWVIADVNNIMNPLDLSELIGTKIRIPDILEVKKLI